MAPWAEVGILNGTHTPARLLTTRLFSCFEIRKPGNFEGLSVTNQSWKGELVISTRTDFFFIQVGIQFHLKTKVGGNARPSQ